MTFTRRTVTTGLLTGAVAASAGARAQGRPRPATIASLLGPDKPETTIWRMIADELGRTAPGRFDLRIVPNAALGAEREVAEGLRLGSVQGTLLTVSTLSSWVPEGQVLDMPFVFKDRVHLRRVLEGGVGQSLIPAYAAKGFTVLGFVIYGVRHLLGKVAFPTPDALKGIKLRVIPSPLHTALWQALGASPTPIPITETYNALRTGVVDAMDLTIPAYAGFKLHEVVPVVTQTGHIWSTGVLVVASSWWQALAPADQELFRAAAQTGLAHFEAAMVADEAESLRLVESAGARVVAVPALAPWQQGARSVWASFGPTVGGLAAIEAIANS